MDCLPSGNPFLAAMCVSAARAGKAAIRWFAAAAALSLAAGARADAADTRPRPGIRVLRPPAVARGGRVGSGDPPLRDRRQPRPAGSQAGRHGDGAHHHGRAGRAHPMAPGLHGRGPDRPGAADRAAGDPPLHLDRARDRRRRPPGRARGPDLRGRPGDPASPQGPTGSAKTGPGSSSTPTSWPSGSTMRWRSTRRWPPRSGRTRGSSPSATSPFRPTRSRSPGAAPPSSDHRAGRAGPRRPDAGPAPSFLRIIVHTPGLAEVLLEVLDVSWWSIVRRRGKVDISITSGGTDVRELALSPWNIDRPGAARAEPFFVVLDGRPALTYRLAAVPPAASAS